MTLEDDLHARLTDLADSAGPWDDPLPDVLARAAEERRTPLEQRRTTPSAPRRRWHELPAVRRSLGAAATIAVIAAAGAGMWHLASNGQRSQSGRPAVDSGRSGRQVPASRSAAGNAGGGAAGTGGGRDATPNASCAAISVRSGAAAATLSAQLSRSATGAVTGVRPQLSLPAGAAAITTTGSVRVIVRRGAQVVAGSSTSAPPVRVTSRAPATWPVIGVPTACAGPAAGRQLPAGDYTLVVAAGYRSATGTGVLVSRPVPITVR